MRQIIIDTETTGLDPAQGHRIIEIAALEIIDRRATGRSVHLRLDPEREIDFGATEVHGMTWDDLKGRPKFGDVAAEFVDFARGAEWIIHNAPFDIAFIDAELRRADVGECAGLHAAVVDTLALARDMFPGKRNSLDALCDRYAIDNSHRSLHGALLDAQLLAEVYLAMTRGQESLSIDIAPPLAAATARDIEVLFDGDGRHAVVIVVEPSAAELAAHEEYLAILQKEAKNGCLWLTLRATPERAAA